MDSVRRKDRGVQTSIVTGKGVHRKGPLAPVRVETRSTLLPDTLPDGLRNFLSTY